MIYLATPYYSPDTIIMNSRFEFCSKYVADRVATGEVIFSPIIYGHTLCQFREMPRDFEFWRDLCFKFLPHCHTIRVLKMEGWELSRGIKAELERAEELGIKIEYEEIN